MNLKNYSLEFTPDKNYCFGFKTSKIIFQGKSKYQKIEILDTPLFGRVLKLDGIFQTSERDEFLYHESLVHPALASHPKPQKILIIGGGDGGTLREALKHKTVKKAILAELDSQVVNLSRKYLKKIGANAFSDHRASIFIGDGKKYIEESKEKFDAIIIDLTDPVGPSLALYTPEFYKTLNSRLNKPGLISLHAEGPIMRPKMHQMMLRNLKQTFKYVRLFTSYIPLYGSEWAFIVASNTLDAATVSKDTITKRLKQRKIKNLRWYSPEKHKAIFVLSPYFKK